MAEKAGISHSSVARIWRAHGLEPHIVRGFKLSNDPQFVEKVRDIVGLYLNPPTNAVVFSFDEGPQIQALERAQPVLPMDLGMPERQTHNYLRHGTLDLFASLNVATGSSTRSCSLAREPYKCTAVGRLPPAITDPGDSPRGRLVVRLLKRTGFRWMLTCVRFSGRYGRFRSRTRGVSWDVCLQRSG
jgi:hypothetical protein